MRRHGVNRRASARSFRKGHRKSRRENMMVARGGFRL